MRGILIQHQVPCLPDVTCASQKHHIPEDTREVPNDSGGLGSCAAVFNVP